METIHVKFDELTDMASEFKNSRSVLAATTLNNKDAPSSSSIIFEDNEAPQIVSSYEEPIADEPTTLVSNQFKKILQNLTKTLSLIHFALLLMIRSRLQTDAKMCMYALTLSTTKSKNIKEAMLNHSWIESMQDEPNQFQRLNVWEQFERPIGWNTIRVKWLWKNKTDAKNMVICNNVLTATTLNNEDVPSSSSIIVEDNEAPQIVSLSKEPIADEPTTLVSNDIIDKSIQEDTAELDEKTFINPFCSAMLEETESSSTTSLNRSMDKESSTLTSDW
ncbi:hypothetical protein Tco_1176535 [Tanacetum coccineum]